MELSSIFQLKKCNWNFKSIIALCPSGPLQSINGNLPNHGVFSIEINKKKSEFAAKTQTVILCLLNIVMFMFFCNKI